MAGTVNISRGIWDDTAFKAEPFTEREAFMWMIMEASYKPREKRVGSAVVRTERGQLATSVRFMSEAWGWSKSRVDRFIKRLENRDMIGTDSGTGINLITICKYDEYQGGQHDSGTAKYENRDSSGTAAGQQRDKPKKGLIPDATQEEGPEGPLSSADDVKTAFDAYNEMAAAAGWPEARILSKARRSGLAARLKDAGGIDGWNAALARARASPLCGGQNSRGWVADLDFLLQPKSFTRLMEGSYDDRSARQSQQSTNRPLHRPDAALEQIARLTGLGEAQGYGRH